MHCQLINYPVDQHFVEHRSTHGQSGAVEDCLAKSGNGITPGDTPWSAAHEAFVDVV